LAKSSSGEIKSLIEEANLFAGRRLSAAVTVRNEHLEASVALAAGELWRRKRRAL